MPFLLLVVLSVENSLGKLAFIAGYKIKRNLCHELFVFENFQKMSYP